MVVLNSGKWRWLYQWGSIADGEGVEKGILTANEQIANEVTWGCKDKKKGKRREERGERGEGRGEGCGGGNRVCMFRRAFVIFCLYFPQDCCQEERENERKRDKKDVYYLQYLRWVERRELSQVPAFQTAILTCTSFWKLFLLRIGLSLHLASL